MKNVVILTALNGLLFTPSKNADGSPKLDKNKEPMGFLRVENPSTIDLRFAYNNGGVKKGASALIPMTVKAWEAAKSAYSNGMELPGRVRIVESLVKEHNGFQAKTAGEGGTPCTLGGKQIYRSTQFDATGILEDVIITHDNVIVGSNVAKSSEAVNK